MQKNKLRFLPLFIGIVISTYAHTATPSRDPFLSLVTLPQKKIGSLQSHWIALYFARAKSVADFISSKKSAILSPQGKVRYDKRSNQLWIKDTPNHITQIQNIVSHLDKPETQFLIQAKIINVDRQYQKALGILFQTQNTELNSTTPLKLNEPVIASQTGQFTISIAKFTGNHLLDMQISALEQEGHAILISSPSLMTLNNQPAVIQSGAEVPYQEATSSGATSVSFKKAVLRLKVTPLRMPHHHILLHITLNQDKVSTLTVNGVPAIETQKITTQVIVNNNQTIVLGGVLETSRSHQISGIPIVDQLPLIGELFRHRMNQIKKEKLLIFITPSTIKI
ncbi:MAG: secretin [Gammaproteobacteria bacterium CG_4_10_14_0_8_um_filter_38_16]|nr:MAG: secretin [Gammaproteobacteria bacterium CG_4_10_14_0_8_um_filter_38_16]PJA03935.1 MAG: secretin [Gammaproteobacteria bacterium CG_4_10_14_0_2_um_filter_38_22]PJB09738.1 MAG: secretin [Gammaproteobacteria bacterium CG_4_9_14_3_um_filter_38_9]